MCHVGCVVFAILNLNISDVKDKRIIEVGSLDVNGSLRPIILNWGPSEYIGVDISKGKGVDVICNAENLEAMFGTESFDVVISTELLEHVKNWRKVISNFKKICKPNGIILITTVSYGFPYHGYPHDYWRYELADMKTIFSDCIIKKLEASAHVNAVFIKAKKPKCFVEHDLSTYTLYCITANKRVKVPYASRSFLLRYLVKKLLSSTLKILRDLTVR